MCTILSLDIGTKYCGIAYSDTKNKEIYPIKTIKFNSDVQKLNIELTDTLIKYNPDIVVIGSSPHPKIELLRENIYIPIIKKALPNIKILEVNEENSTKMATSFVNLYEYETQHLLKFKGKYNKVKKKKQHGIIDQASAIILLQKAYEKNLINC